jgi:predicted nucleic acid-binding protein
MSHLSNSLALRVAKVLTGTITTINTWGRPWPIRCGPRRRKTLLMTDIFVDTADWVRLVDSTQTQHVQAATLYRTGRQQGRKFITTNYILAELGALLTSPLRISRPAIIGFINSLKTSPYVEIAHIDATLDEQAWRLLSQRRDKGWSLVDCASCVLMKQRGLLAFTTDEHFEQAGFTRLLRL